MKTLLISDDKTVTKIVHDDDSETAIKTVSSCDTEITEDGEFKLKETDRNKFSVFISNSAGCFMKCKFCYLTLKKMKHQRIKTETLRDNFIEALRERTLASIDGDLTPTHQKFIKICWMGMGDAMIASTGVKESTEFMLDYAMGNNFTVGLDGVDLSTVFPDMGYFKEALNDFKKLDEILQKYPLNPHNDVIVHRAAEYSNTEPLYQNRSRFRLFYSLHSAIQKTRDELIPNAKPLEIAIPALINYSENNKYNVIFHHMFIDGFNDSDEEIDALINLIDEYNLYDYELRILRYNTCEVSTFIHESDHFKSIIRRLTEVHSHVKVQVSAGSEVKAACGQFLTNN